MPRLRRPSPRTPSLEKGLQPSSKASSARQRPCVSDLSVCALTQEIEGQGASSAFAPRKLKQAASSSALATSAKTGPAVRKSLATDLCGTVVRSQTRNDGASLPHSAMGRSKARGGCEQFRPSQNVQDWSGLTLRSVAEGPIWLPVQGPSFRCRAGRGCETLCV